MPWHVPVGSVSWPPGHPCPCAGMDNSSSFHFSISAAQVRGDHWCPPHRAGERQEASAGDLWEVSPKQAVLGARRGWGARHDAAHQVLFLPVPPARPPPNRYTYGKPVQGKVQATVCRPFLFGRVMYIPGPSSPRTTCIEVGGQVSKAGSMGDSGTAHPQDCSQRG